MLMPSKFSVLGTGVSATSYQEVLGLAREWVVRKRAWEENGHSSEAPAAHWVGVLTVNAVMTAFFDAAYQSLLNQSDVSTPDGKPLAWALRSMGAKAQPRVYGPNLMLYLCEQAAKMGHRVFLFGGRTECVHTAAEKLCEKYPGLIIAGKYAHRDPPATSEAKAASIAAIRESGADIVFVGFGQPRQEKWMEENRDQLPGVLMVGIGAAVDFHAGRVKQAPVWMQEAGLEWLFRLIMEPRRLWRRYVLYNPPFLVLWALQWMGLMKYPILQQGSARRA